MIKKLTLEQEKLMKIVADEWMDLIFKPKGKIDREKATEGIYWLYDFVGLKKPKVVFVESPLGAQYMANVRSNVRSNVLSNVRSNVRSNVLSNVWSNVESKVKSNVESNVRDNVGSNVRSNVSSNVSSNVLSNVRDNVESNVRSKVRSNVKSNVESNVWANVLSNVWSNVWSNVLSNVWSNVEADVLANKFRYFDFARYGSVSDFGWLAYYDFFEKIGLKYDTQAWGKFKQLMKSGFYDMIQFDGLCVVCEMPSSVYRKITNSVGVLHNDEGKPAIAWDDGYELYAIDGVIFDKYIYDKIINKKITATEVTKLDNTEQRMIALKYLSADEFIKGVNGKQIGLPTTRGNTLHEGVVENEKIWFLRFKCPSTGREYIEFTNPEAFADDLKRLNGDDIDIYNPDALQAYAFVFDDGKEKKHLSLMEYLEMEIET